MFYILLVLQNHHHLFIIREVSVCRIMCCTLQLVQGFYRHSGISLYTNTKGVVYHASTAISVLQVRKPGLLVVRGLSQNDSCQSCQNQARF